MAAMFTPPKKMGPGSNKKTNPGKEKKDQNEAPPENGGKPAQEAPE